MGSSPDSSSSCTAADIPAYILCGGQSARFGTDKARVWIDSQPHLLRLAKSLRKQGHETHFVSDREDRYEDLGIATIVDVQPKSGPIAGLIAAAKHRAKHLGSGWFLLLSCDQWLWKSGYFQTLANGIQDHRIAITFRDNLVQPIPGLYHTKIEAHAASLLAAGQLSMKRMLESLDAAFSIEAEDNPRDWCFNNPDELKVLLDRFATEFEK